MRGFAQLFPNHVSVVDVVVRTTILVFSLGRVVQSQQQEQQQQVFYDLYLGSLDTIQKDCTGPYDLGRLEFQCGPGGVVSSTSGTYSLGNDVECTVDTTDTSRMTCAGTGGSDLPLPEDDGYNMVVVCTGSTDESVLLVSGGYSAGSLTNCTNASRRFVGVSLICRDELEVEAPFRRKSEDLVSGFQCRSGNVTEELNFGCTDLTECVGYASDPELCDTTLSGTYVEAIVERIPGKCIWPIEGDSSAAGTDIVQPSAFYVVGINGPDAEDPSSGCSEFDTGTVTFRCGPDGIIDANFDDASLCVKGNNECTFDYNYGLFSTDSPLVVACSGQTIEAVALEVVWAPTLLQCADLGAFYYLEVRQACVGEDRRPFDQNRLYQVCYPFATSDDFYEGCSWGGVHEARPLTSVLPVERLDLTCVVASADLSAEDGAGPVGGIASNKSAASTLLFSKVSIVNPFALLVLGIAAAYLHY